MTTTIPNVEHVPNNNTSVTPVAREYEADVVVDARDETAEDVVTLTLREIRHHPLPRWEPGAHVDLLLPDGLTRQYSLCGDPADHHLWRIGVLRERPGPGGSAYVHDRLYAGTPIRVRGPRNHFPLLPSPRYLFIAGGIGITPIMPMIAAAEAAARNGTWSTAAAGACRWRFSTSSLGTATMSRSGRRTRPDSSTSTACSVPARRHAHLLLRPGTTAGCRRGTVHELARGLTAHRAVYREATHRTGPRREFRGRAATERAGCLAGRRRQDRYPGTGLVQRISRRGERGRAASRSC